MYTLAEYAIGDCNRDDVYRDTEPLEKVKPILDKNARIAFRDERFTRYQFADDSAIVVERVVYNDWWFAVHADRLPEAQALFDASDRALEDPVWSLAVDDMFKVSDLGRDWIDPL